MQGETPWRIRPRFTYANVVSTMALFVAVGTGGAIAAKTELISSGDIQNGAVRSVDIHKSAVKSSDLGKGAVASSDLRTNAVQSADIGTGAVQTADIGQGEVQPGDMSLPEPVQLEDQAARSAETGSAYVLVGVVGSYAKGDPGSALEVDWTGTASAGAASCIFQLRVDGQAAGAGGLVYVQNSSTVGVSAAALFSGLSSGNHSIEVWARLAGDHGAATYPCTIGPAAAGVSQTFVVTELIV